jgi:hypothetical protein
VKQFLGFAIACTIAGSVGYMAATADWMALVREWEAINRADQAQIQRLNEEILFMAEHPLTQLVTVETCPDPIVPVVDTGGPYPTFSRESQVYAGH